MAAIGANLTYQWRKDGAPLAGATNASFTVSNIQPQNAGIYTVVVTSGATSASASAVLGFTATAKVSGAGTEVAVLNRNRFSPTFNQVQRAPIVFIYELKNGLEAYLKKWAKGTAMRKIDDIIAFNLDHPEKALRFGQDLFLAAAQTKGDLSEPEYKSARRMDRASGLHGNRRIVQRGWRRRCRRGRGRRRRPGRLHRGRHGRQQREDRTAHRARQ